MLKRCLVVIGLLLPGCMVDVPEMEGNQFSCVTGDDCASGYACVNGFCNKSGGSGGDHGGGGDSGGSQCPTCIFPQKCVNDHCELDVTACSTGHDTGYCPEGYTCKEGVCYDGGGACDVYGSMTCTNGGACTKVTQCPDGVACNPGTACGAGQICRRVGVCVECTPACAPWQQCSGGVCSNMSTPPPAERCVGSSECSAHSPRTQCNAAGVCEEPGCMGGVGCSYAYACHLGTCVSDPRACTNGGDYCTGSDTCVSNNCVPACQGETFNVGTTSFSDCVTPCSGDAQCNSAEDTCVFDPGVSVVTTRVCRKSCLIDSDCPSSSGKVCRFVANDTGAAGWGVGGVHYRACVQGDESNSSFTGRRPAWFASQQFADSGLCANAPCMFADVGKEQQLAVWNASANSIHVAELTLRDSWVLYRKQVGTTYWKAEAQPLDGSTTCVDKPSIPMSAGGMWLGPRLVHDTPTTRAVAYTCQAAAAGDCGSGSSAGKHVFKQPVTVASGCLISGGVPVRKSFAADMNGLIDFDASDTMAAVADNAMTAPMATLRRFAPLTTLNYGSDSYPVASTVQNIAGRIAVGLDRAFFTDAPTEYQPHGRIAWTMFDGTSTDLQVSSAPVCQLEVGRDRIVWTRLSNGSTCIAAGDNHQVWTAEGPDYAFPTQLGTQLSGSVNPTVVRTSGTVVAWADRQEALGTFRIYALDLTDWDMHMGPTTSVNGVLVERFDNSAGSCPGTTSTGIKWSLVDFAIESDEVGKLSLAFVVDCRNTAGTSESTVIYGRKFFP